MGIPWTLDLVLKKVGCSWHGTEDSTSASCGDWGKHQKVFPCFLWIPQNKKLIKYGEKSKKTQRSVLQGPVTGSSWPCVGSGGNRKIGDMWLFKTAEKQRFTWSQQDNKDIISSALLHVTAHKPFREKRWCMCPMGTAEIKILQFSMLVYVFTNIEKYKYRTFVILKLFWLIQPHYCHLCCSYRHQNDV